MTQTLSLPLPIEQDTNRANSTASAAPTTNPMHALAALCGVARFHQVAADPALLAHQLGISSSDCLGIDNLLRGAQHLGLKAKLTKTTAERLALTALPALALMRTPDQSLRVVILAQCDEKRVLFQETTGNVGGAEGGAERHAPPSSQWRFLLISGLGS